MLLLVKEEWKKLRFSKGFAFFLALPVFYLGLLASFLFFQQGQPRQKAYQEKAKEIAVGLEEGKGEGILRKLDEERERIDLAIQFSLIPPALRADAEEEMVQAYAFYQPMLARDPNYLERQAKEVLAPLSEKLSYYLQASTQYQQISHALEKRLLHPLYDKDSFSRRSLLRQERAFRQSAEGLKELAWGPEEGMILLSKSIVLDLLLFFLVFLLARKIYGPELRERLGFLLESTQTGIKRIALAKGLLLLFLSVSLLLFSFLSLIVLFACFSMLPPLGAAVQSLEILAWCPEPFSVGSFLLFFLLLKIPLAILYAMLASFFVCGFSKRSKDFLLFTLLLLLSGIFYLQIPDRSIWNMLKFAGFFGLADTFSTLSSYQDVALLGLPIDRKLFFLLFTIVSIVLFAVFAFFLFLKNAFRRKERVSWTLSDHFLIHRLFGLEIWRMLFQQKALLFFLAYALLAITWTPLEKENAFRMDRQYYLQSFYPVRGKANAKTEEKFVEMEKVYRTLPGRERKLEEAVRNGKMDADTYRIRIQGLEEEKARKPYFYQVKAQWMMAKTVTKGKHPIYLIDRDAQKHFLNYAENGWLFQVSSCVFFLLLLSGLLATDRQGLNGTLLRTTSRGETKLLLLRMALLFLFSFFLLLVFHASYWASAQSKGFLLPMDASIFSLPAFPSFGLELSIGQFFALLVIYQLLTLFLLALFVLFFCLFQKDTWTGALLAGFFLLLPMLLEHFFAWNIFSYLPWLHGFHIAGLLAHRSFYYFLYDIVITILGILFLTHLCIKLWRKKE